ncbi:MAG TPA: aromatic acid exporter family protein [Verrucomicrobiae bacterium]
MQARHFDAILLSSKAAVSAIVAVPCYNLFGLPGAIWASISAVLVIQPGLNPSLRASLMRVVANLIGAFIGAVLITLIGQTLTALAAGVLLTGLVCYLARLEDAVRPAYAAVVIVTFTSGAGKAAWTEPLERVLAVMTGCACSLAAGFVIDKLAGRLKIRHKDEKKNHETSE